MTGMRKRARNRRSDAGDFALVWTGRNRASITARLDQPRPRGGLGAQVAQLVEHVTENHGVGGSIPPLGTINLFSLIFIHPHQITRKLVLQAFRST